MKLGGVTLRFSKMGGFPPPPPHVSNRPKSPCLLGLSKMLHETSNRVDFIRISNQLLSHHKSNRLWFLIEVKMKFCSFASRKYEYIVVLCQSENG